MIKNDSLDERLIRLLQQNGRQSSDVLAKQLNISSATVRRRIKKLIQSGLMRVVAVVDPEKAGFPFIALIALDVHHNQLDSAMKFLANRPEVTWVSATTGRFDIIISARFPTADDFSKFLRVELAKVEGLKDSESFLCVYVEKGRYIQI